MKWSAVLSLTTKKTLLHRILFIRHYVHCVDYYGVDYYELMQSG